MSLSFRRRRIDYRPYLRNSIRWKAAALCVFFDHLFVWRDVDAINLVVRHITLHPLDFRAEVSQYSRGFFRDILQLVRRKFSRVRNLAFNDEFRHNDSVSTSSL